MAEPENYGRDTAGRFGPGNPGKPRGARNRNPIELAAAARTYSASALATVVDLLRHADADIRLRAAQELFNRGFGRPPMALAVKVGAQAEPLDPATLDDAQLDALLQRLEAFVAQATVHPVIDVEPVELREAVVDQPSKP